MAVKCQEGERAELRSDCTLSLDRRGAQGPQKAMCVPKARQLCRALEGAAGSPVPVCAPSQGQREAQHLRCVFRFGKTWVCSLLSTGQTVVPGGLTSVPVSGIGAPGGDPIVWPFSETLLISYMHIYMLRFLFLIGCGLVEFVGFVFVFWICCSTVSVLCFGFLALRHVGSWLPDQGLNPHSLHWSSVQSLSRVWLRLRGLQHTRPPCPSPTPGVYSNLMSIEHQWCHPTISSSVVPFSSCPQSFPASGSSPVSQFFASGGQRIGVSASASVLPMNIQDWFPFGWTGWISLQSKGLSRVFSNTTVKSINSSAFSFLYSPILTSIRDYWKNHSLD